ncbi:MAG: AAA family ATPase [Trueperaceae bacterium]|nr:AAA family ATPase [Trueperaceae bacterium]
MSATHGHGFRSSRWSGPANVARLAEPELYLEQHEDALVVLDEVQRVPELFPVLRTLVDARRTPLHFIILGSASPDLLRPSSESLAGRVRYFELCPFTLDEVAHLPDALRRLWLRGGSRRASCRARS